MFAVDWLSPLLFFETSVLYRLCDDASHSSIACTLTYFAALERPPADSEARPFCRRYARSRQPRAGAATDVSDSLCTDAFSGDGRELRGICALFLHFAERMDGHRSQSRFFCLGKRESI